MKNLRVPPVSLFSAAFFEFFSAAAWTGVVSSDLFCPFHWFFLSGSYILSGGKNKFLFWLSGMKKSLFCRICFNPNFEQGFQCLSLDPGDHILKYFKAFFFINHQRVLLRILPAVRFLLSDDPCSAGYLSINCQPLPASQDVPDF